MSGNRVRADSTVISTYTERETEIALERERDSETEGEAIITQ